MKVQNILAAIKDAVDLRNKIQTAIADGAHILPARAAVAATETAPAIPVRPALPTGQLVVAAGMAHTLAINLQNHLALIESDAAILKSAAELIAKPAPAPEPKTAPATNGEVRVGIEVPADGVMREVSLNTPPPETVAAPTPETVETK